MQKQDRSLTRYNKYRIHPLSTPEACGCVSLTGDELEAMKARVTPLHRIRRCLLEEPLAIGVSTEAVVKAGRRYKQSHDLLR